MMLDATAYYGQPTMIVPQLTPHGLVGALPGQYGQLAGQAIAGCLGPQQLTGQLGVLPQAARFLPFEGGVMTLAPTLFGSPAGFGGVFGNPFASYGQSIGGWPSLQPLGAVGPQAVFGGLGSPLGQQTFGQQPFGPSIGGWHGSQHQSGLGLPGFFATPWSPFGQQTFGAQAFGPPIGLQSLFGGLTGQYGQPLAAIGAWPGQSSIFNQQLAGALGRGFPPYQAVPQLAYAG